MLSRTRALMRPGVRLPPPTAPRQEQRLPTDQTGSIGPHESATDTAPGRVAVNRRIGPYQLVKELGRGGMGTVYLAERADALYYKRVAIKVVRGVDSDEVIRHLQRERRILASLDHRPDDPKI